MLLTAVLSVCVLLTLMALRLGRDPLAWPRARLPDLPQGERVLAVIRPDPEVGFSLAALGLTGYGLAVALLTLLLGSDALLPAALALGLLATPLAVDRVCMMRRAWVVTERRLIAGPALDLPLADLVRVRILPLAVEVEGRGNRRLRLPALVNPAPAGRLIHDAATGRLPG
jgi:hypothetical protein